MAVKIYKPKTNGQRHKTSYTFEEITKTRPERSLIVVKKERAGRNSSGRVTVRHRGGGARRALADGHGAMRLDHAEVPGGPQHRVPRRPRHQRA